MSLDRRLARLEQRPMSGGRLAERADSYARTHDFPLEDVLGEMGRVVALSPAERAREAAALLASAPPASECAAHGGPPCGEALRRVAEGGQRRPP